MANSKRLVELGMVPTLAREVASQIDGGSSIGAAIDGNGPAPINRGVLFFGDSFPYRHTANGNVVTGQPWDNSANPVGNRYISHGEFNWVRYRTRQAFTWDGSLNYGIAGETNPQISARLIPFVANSQIAKPQTLIRICSVNSTSDSAYYQESMDALAADYVACRLANIYMVILTPAPTGNSSFAAQRMSAVKRAQRNRLRYDLMALYAFSNKPGVDCIDMDTGYADPASTLGDTLANMVSDGTHTSTLGASVRAYRYDAIFSRRFFPRNYEATSNTDIYDATNNPRGAVNTNPAMTGSGGTPGTGGSGSIPDSWVGGNGGDTGHTRTYSKVAAGPNTGRPVARCALGGTFGASAQDISLFFQNLTVVQGARYKLQVEFDGWSGVTGLQQITAKVINTDTFAILAADMDYSGNVGIIQPTEKDGMMESPDFVADGPNLRIRIDGRGVANAAMAGAVDVLSSKLIRLN